MTQNTTPHGPIFKARLLPSRKCGGAENGGVATFLVEIFPKAYHLIFAILFVVE